MSQILELITIGSGSLAALLGILVSRSFSKAQQKRFSMLKLLGRNQLKVLGIIIALSVITVAASMINVIHSRPVVFTVKVDAGHEWTDTNFFLNEGDYVTITALGSIKIAESDPGKNPNGAPGLAAEKEFPAPGLDKYSLIGRIDEISPFPVGEGLKFIAPANGELQLGVNDSAISDNSGHWTATIIVERK